MRKSVITKKIIAKALKDLMKKEDFSKISTANIMTLAGIRRQTFYNHFADKYELIEWIFEFELSEQVSDNLDYLHWKTTINTLLNYLQSNKLFYKKAFDISGQNSFNSFFTSKCLEIVETIYKNNENIIDEKEYLFTLEYHSIALANFIKEKINTPDYDITSCESYIISVFDNLIKKDSN